MQITTVGTYQVGLGTLVALLVIVAVIVLWLISRLDAQLALLIGAVAFARLI